MRWLTEYSQAFLDDGYLLPGQTAQDAVWLKATTAEKILNKPGFAKKFYDYFERGWYSFSTPVWTNFGTDRGLPISCFGATVYDNMWSILDVASEVGMQSKYGGGTSGYFGHLRPRGSSIKNNGESAGSVHFMQLFDTMANIVNQGSTRRGSFAAYLPVDHKDIFEFLTIQSEGHPIQKMHFGVCIPDGWMQSMIDGDAQKRKVWAKIIESRLHKAEPYIVFLDNVNNNTVDVYKDKGMRITHSNLCCVTGDQRVVSDRGLLTAEELYEQGGNLTLFDGNQTISASEMKLISQKSPVYKITLSNGMNHKVTPCHKVQTNKGMVKTENLKIGDKISTQIKKGLFGTLDMQDEAFLLGLYQADGTQHKDVVMIDIWENDFDLIDEIEEKFNSIFYKYGCNKYENTNQYGSVFFKEIKPPKFYDCVVSQSKVKKKRLASKTLKKALSFEKGYVPDWVWISNEATQWQYIRGLYYADGTVNVCKNADGQPLYLSLSNGNKKFLEEIQIILANLGIKSSIYIGRKEGTCLLPDGKGGHKLFNTKDNYRLVTGNKNNAIIFEENTKFLTRKSISLDKNNYRDNTKKFSKIVKIEYIGEFPVYCCEVYTDEHKWICNGFATHNSEILLPDNEEESFVCDLGSMNLLWYDEWKNTDAVETKIYFLDSIMTEFIQKARNLPGMERAVRFAERHRALGLGVFGWHSYLQANMIPFESMEAKYKNVEIFKLLQAKSYEASRRLAVEYGEPEVLKGYGRRNTTTMAPAPTTSSAFIIGQSSSTIEPWFDNYFTQNLAKGKFSVKNPQLEKVLEEKGKNNHATWLSILKKQGSVQHLEFLTDHEKAVFKTFPEISQKEIIIQAAGRQPYIDQGQSTNLFIHPSTSAKNISKLYIEAWQLGCKTLYYQHGKNAAKEFTDNLLVCRNCEG